MSPTSLRELGRDLYCIDHDFRLAGVRLGGRTSIVRMADDALLLHSPGPITDADEAALSAAGSVEVLLAPNLQHHVHLEAARHRWPRATVLGVAGLRQKRPDLPFDAWIGGESPLRDLPPRVAACLEPIFVAGMPDLDEVALFHRASRTMILTDVAFHVCAPQPLWTQMFMRLNGGWNRLAPPRPVRSMLKDRGLARASIEALLACDFDRVVVAHGSVLESGGREALRAGYAWLLAADGASR